MAALNSKDQALHQQFSDYGRNAKEWMRKCELLLPEIERRKVWCKKRFSSIYEYAAKLAGMSRARVDDSLRIFDRIQDKPSLLKLAKERGLQRVRPVATIATLDDEFFWAEKARQMTKNTLETYVHDYRLENRLRTGNEPEKVVFQVKQELSKKLEQLKKRADFETLLEKFVEAVERQDEAKKKKKVETLSRHIPTQIQHYVEYKTAGLCAYPGCTRPATSLHHTQRWALEKVHDPDRLQALCTAHERLAHKGLIDNEEAAPEKWKLRTEPDKTLDKFYIDSMVALYRPT